MNNSYNLIPTRLFLDDLRKLSKKGKSIVKDKLKLLKINPFRNKKLHYPNLFLFRIRFSDQQKEKRIVYLIEKNNVKIICILDRENDYRELRKYLGKCGIKFALDWSS